jgi:hypothetical protein
LQFVRQREHLRRSVLAVGIHRVSLSGTVQVALP